MTLSRRRAHFYSTVALAVVNIPMASKGTPLRPGPNLHLPFQITSTDPTFGACYAVRPRCVAMLRIATTRQPHQRRSNNWKLLARNGSYDWSSEALNASEKLAQVASDSNVLSGESHLCEPHQRTKLISVKKTAAWAWLLGVFASIGAFFATSWQYVGASARNIYGNGSLPHGRACLSSCCALVRFRRLRLRPSSSSGFHLDARNAIIVWFVVFWICVLIPLALGFGPVGVIGGASIRSRDPFLLTWLMVSFRLSGSLAAWFQSVIYGAFTPAGGFFAVMTSVGMMGVACPPVAVPSMIIASLAAWITWSMSST
ncbi:hypothetical protein AG1IA_08441 [Rhizoctonia solani AG-1 IA]|uniref:Uncharacterized protein n=1 Tax=Thanatephorus cucumeris (strain AG1-IA) TaxID=983506 RepID=L8WH48_THACA|nr:hypothetical protein AG1IA_08441 [Rhizoctonia solani AG-1 IA]